MAYENLYYDRCERDEVYSLVLNAIATKLPGVHYLSPHWTEVGPERVYRLPAQFYEGFSILARIHRLDTEYLPPKSEEKFNTVKKASELLAQIETEIKGKQHPRQLAFDYIMKSFLWRINQAALSFQKKSGRMDRVSFDQMQIASDIFELITGRRKDLAAVDLACRQRERCQAVYERINETKISVSDEFSQLCRNRPAILVSLRQSMLLLILKENLMTRSGTWRAKSFSQDNIEGVHEIDNFMLDQGLRIFDEYRRDTGEVVNALEPEEIKRRRAFLDELNRSGSIFGSGEYKDFEIYKVNRGDDEDGMLLSIILHCRQPFIQEVDDGEKPAWILWDTNRFDLSTLTQLHVPKSAAGVDIPRLSLADMRGATVFAKSASNSIEYHAFVQGFETQQGNRPEPYHAGVLCLEHTRDRIFRDQMLRNEFNPALLLLNYLRAGKRILMYGVRSRDAGIHMYHPFDRIDNPKQCYQEVYYSQQAARRAAAETGALVIDYHR